MSTNHSEISSFIWNVCDDVLRGLFKPHEYGDIILPFTVLRRLDCVLEEHKDTVINLHNEYKSKVEDPTPIILNKIDSTFFNYSQYDLSRLRQDSSNVLMNFQNYIGGFSENVVEIVENFQLEKPIDKLNKNNRLYQFIEKFSEIDLHPNKVSNHQMGQVFEELLRKFSEMSNETSGEHYTPRDVVRLLVSLVFSEDKKDLQGEGKIRSIFDPCCGTGGMLTIGKDWVQENINEKIEFRLLGQELNPQTYSICKSDMMIIGENPENIRQGSSLSEDKFQGEKFDYMLTNPPYGVSWKTEKEFVKNESENINGRFSHGVPTVKDGQLLFLQHMISKMEPTGSRIGVVLSGSAMFTGVPGSGESKIRKWIIENDLLETIVSLPDKMFFNTDISTYIWILSNKKSCERKGKIQLIDGSELFTPLKKNLGKKNKYIDSDSRNVIFDTINSFKESDISKIFSNSHFGYTKITIEKPLIKDGLPIMDKKNKPIPDPDKREFEYVPINSSVEEHISKTVTPFIDDFWLDRGKDKIGYDIVMSKYFEKKFLPRKSTLVKKDIDNLESKVIDLFQELFSS